VTAWRRCNLAMQGFGELSDSELRARRLGLTLVPGFTLAGVIAGLATGSPALLVAWAAIMAVGAAAPSHPVDLLYDHGARHLVGGSRLGRTPAPRRFSSAMAATMLATLGAAFALDAGTALVVALGIPMVASPATILLTDWCLPAFLYGHGLRLLRRAVVF
jgi:hypothetical protein